MLVSRSNRLKPTYWRYRACRSTFARVHGESPADSFILLISMLQIYLIDIEYDLTIPAETENFLCENYKIE